MAKQVPGQPYNGPLTIDLKNLTGRLVDLEHGAMQLLRAEQEGIGDVGAELKASVPTLGDAAGVPKDVYSHFLDATDTLSEVRAARAIVDKLAEVLKETEAKFEHDRENDISIISEAVKAMSRLKGDPTLLAGFEKTLKYNAQAGDKAAKTRKKNEEAKKAIAGEVAKA